MPKSENYNSCIHTSSKLTQKEVFLVSLYSVVNMNVNTDLLIYNQTLYLHKKMQTVTIFSSAWVKSWAAVDRSVSTPPFFFHIISLWVGGASSKTMSVSVKEVSCLCIILLLISLIGSMSNFLFLPFLFSAMSKYKKKAQMWLVVQLCKVIF